MYPSGSSCNEAHRQGDSSTHTADPCDTSTYELCLIIPAVAATWDTSSEEDHDAKEQDLSDLVCPADS